MLRGVEQGKRIKLVELQAAKWKGSHHIHRTTKRLLKKCQGELGDKPHQLGVNMAERKYLNFRVS